MDILFRFGVIFSTCVLLAQVSTAENIANPLYLLDDDDEPKACKAFDKPDQAKEGDSAQQQAQEQFSLVSRDRIICNLTEQAQPEIPYSDLRQHISAKSFDPLLFAIVPCAKPKPTEQVDGENRKGEPVKVSTDADKLYKDFVKRCALSETDFVKTPELRFSKKPNNLFIRQSLLALFQSAEYGKRNQYIVLRQNWHEGNLKSSEYRPLVNQFHDDVALVRYLMGKPSFLVSKDPSNLEGEASNQATAFVIAANTGDQKATLPTKACDNPEQGDGCEILGPIRSGYASPFDRVYSEVTEFSAPRKYTYYDQDKRKDGQPLSANERLKTSKATLGLQVVAASEDFAKTKPTGAKIGTSINGATDGTIADDDEAFLNADLAIGLPFKWTRTFKYNNRRLVPEKTVFTLTPFLSVDAQPQSVTSLTMIDGEEVAQKRLLDSATLAAGIRLDYERTSNMKTPYSEAIGSRYLSLAGRDIPGWKFSLVYEGLTDNYNLWSAQRGGFLVSPPSIFSTPGYRSAYPLDAMSRDPIKPGELAQATERNWVDGFLNGWYFEWDTALALDYIDYARLPRKFDDNFPFVINDNVPEYGLYGGDLEFSLTKRHLFGASTDDAWMMFEVDYTYREGFGDNSKTTNHVELSLKLMDPAESNRFVGITYKDGFNYRTQENEDLLGFEFGAKY